MRLSIKMKLVLLPEFSAWLSHETMKSRAQIEDGDAKSLGDGLAELKWAK